MASNITGFIQDLKKSHLNATCPNCRNEFSLTKAILFDGTKQFPQTAELTRLEWEQRLVDRISDLKVLRKKTASRSQTGAIASGIGKILEKILPAHKNFDMESADWRFLGEPIDNIQFHGLVDNKIKNITFMEIKTENGKLQENQKQIRDAVNDHKVKWRYL